MEQTVEEWKFGGNVNDSRDISIIGEAALERREKQKRIIVWHDDNFYSEL